MRKMQLIWILSCCLFVLGNMGAKAQNQLFWVHEDQVRPGMVQEYEELSKELVAEAKKGNLQNMSWSVAAMDNGRHLSITPVKDMADIQTKSFEPLMASMGEDRFNQMMNKFNTMYDKHGNYLIVLDSELSYMPNGLDPVTPGQDYRKWHNMAVSAENVGKLREKLAELKDIYSKKGAKEYYRIYRSSFGNMGDYFVAVVSAKDAEDYARMSSETNQLLGEEGEQKFGEVMDLVTTYEVMTGKMKPELAYSPQASQMPELPTNDD